MKKILTTILLCTGFVAFGQSSENIDKQATTSSATPLNVVVLSPTNAIPAKGYIPSASKSITTGIHPQTNQNIVVLPITTAIPVSQYVETVPKQIVVANGNTGSSSKTNKKVVVLPMQQVTKFDKNNLPNTKKQNIHENPNKK